VANGDMTESVHTGTDSQVGASASASGEALGHTASGDTTQGTETSTVSQPGVSATTTGESLFTGQAARPEALGLLSLMIVAALFF
jgi:hypothetical protein